MKMNLGKKLSIGVIALLSPWLMNAQDKQTHLEVSLEEAIEIALSDNPTIKIADQEIKRVDYSKKSAWYGLLPTVDGTGQVGKYLVPGTMSFAGMKIDMPTDWTVSLGLQAALPLIAPGLWKSIQLTDLDMQEAVEKARFSKISLRNSVEKAYYQTLLAQDSYSVLQDYHEVAKTNRDLAKKAFEVGAVAEYDYISAEVSVANLQPTLLSVENGITQLKKLLKVLMGVDISVSLETKGHLSDYESQILALNGTTNIDLSNNTDLKQLEIGLLKLDKALQIQKTQLLPTLAAFGTYTHAGQGNKAMNSPFTGEYTPANTAWFGQGLIVGLQLSVPIFHASNFTNIKAAKTQSNITKMQRDYIESQLEVQARSYLDNMNQAAKQVDAAKTAITLAQKAYDISAKRYETGMGTMLELDNATTKLKDTRLSYENAIDSYLEAKADYEKITGQQ
jgi:outer membrane protein TolC